MEFFIRDTFSTDLQAGKKQYFYQRYTIIIGVHFIKPTWKF